MMKFFFRSNCGKCGAKAKDKAKDKNPEELEKEEQERINKEFTSECKLMLESCASNKKTSAQFWTWYNLFGGKKEIRDVMNGILKHITDALKKPEENVYFSLFKDSMGSKEWVPLIRAFIQQVRYGINFLKEDCYNFAREIAPLKKEWGEMIAECEDEEIRQNFAEQLNETVSAENTVERFTVAIEAKGKYKAAKALFDKARRHYDELSTKMNEEIDAGPHNKEKILSVLEKYRDDILAAKQDCDLKFKLMKEQRDLMNFFPPNKKPQSEKTEFAEENGDDGWN
jgi:hypothetical protein